MIECNFDDTDILKNILHDDSTADDIMNFLDTLLTRYKDYFECRKNENILRLIKIASDIQQSLNLRFNYAHILLCFIADKTREKKISSPTPREDELERPLTEDEIENIKDNLMEVCNFLKAALTLEFIISCSNGLTYSTVYLYIKNNKDVIRRYIPQDSVQNVPVNLIDFVRNNSFLAHGGFILPSTPDVIENIYGRLLDDTSLKLNDFLDKINKIKLSKE